MKAFAESGFDELDMEYFEEHGLNTDRHMINQEELEKLLDASVNMSKEGLDCGFRPIYPIAADVRDYKRDCLRRTSHEGRPESYGELLSKNHEVRERRQLERVL